MKKGEEIKRITKQEAATSQPWNGALQLCLCSQTTALLQAICSGDNSGSGNSEKVTKKERRIKKKEKNKKALESDSLWK